MDYSAKGIDLAKRAIVFGLTEMWNSFGIMPKVYYYTLIISTRVLR